MNKNIIRLAGGFAILLGLAYLGNKIIVPATRGTTTAGAGAELTGVAGGAGGYAVYPDRATEAALGLDYATFNGNFAQDLTVTPLPPQFPGAAMLRLLPGDAWSLQVRLNDPRCASTVHVALYRINDRQAVANVALNARALEASFPFSDGKIPSMLMEVRMDEKAENNYWCGVNVHWNRNQTPAA